MSKYSKNEIINKTILCENVIRFDIYSPMVAKKAEPGEFIILRVFENGERIPLTIANFDKNNGVVSIIFQSLGATTIALASLNEGDIIHDFVGPLGNMTKLDNINNAIVIGGGVGCAIALPIAKKLHDCSKYVTSIIGFKNKDFVILEDEFNKVSNNLIVMTDDGSYKNKGFVTNALMELLSNNSSSYDEIIVIGSLPMMKAVSEVSKRFNVKTTVSMNSIMIDGTGMCGCCRVKVGGVNKFACVDGPDFDGWLVDFDEAIKRSSTYIDFENKAREDACNLFRKDAK